MNLRMALASSMLLIIVGLSPLAATAQPATQPASHMSGMNMAGQGQAQSAQTDKMADAMTAMAQTCQTMMQREHEMLRYAVIGGSVIGVLLLIALILFIILEIQWIRFFGVRIQTEKRKLT